MICHDFLSFLNLTNLVVPMTFVAYIYSFHFFLFPPLTKKAVDVGLRKRNYFQVQVDIPMSVKSKVPVFNITSIVLLWLSRDFYYLRWPTSTLCSLKTLSALAFHILVVPDGRSAGTSGAAERRLSLGWLCGGCIDTGVVY